MSCRAGRQNVNVAIRFGTGALTGGIIGPVPQSTGLSSMATLTRFGHCCGTIAVRIHRARTRTQSDPVLQSRAPWNCVSDCMVHQKALDWKSHDCFKQQWKDNKMRGWPLPDAEPCRPVAHQIFTDNVSFIGRYENGVVLGKKQHRATTGHCQDFRLAPQRHKEPQPRNTL